MRKRITAVLAAASMTLAMLPAGAFAVYADEPDAVSAGASAEFGEETIKSEIPENLPEEETILPGACEGDDDGDDIGEAGQNEIREEKTEDGDEKNASFREVPGAGEMYTREAVAMDLANLPGVYTVKAYPGDNKESATMGIPSVSRLTLTQEHGPTTESPAIITGGAVGFETRIPGTVDFEHIKDRIAPYSYFRYGYMDEPGPDGTTHRKLTGFDESYYIIRVDVSGIIEQYLNKDKVYYLHVRQENNKALMVASGMDKTTYADGMGNKSGSYSLADLAEAMKDTDGEYRDTPYLDVILMSSGKLAAGADAGKQGAPSADVPLYFYVDEEADYDPLLTELDPNKQYTWPYKAPNGVTYQTEKDYIKALLEKFYRDSEASGEDTNASSYVVKGEDLEIDVEVDEQTEDESLLEYWSLPSAMRYQEFDSHEIRLICEVPVLEPLVLEDTDEGSRNVIFDVNSFDIQIADNTEHDIAGLTIGNNATLTVTDRSNTAGAELAIGNNATMEVKKGGTMIIAEDSALEVEYDAATRSSAEEQGGDEVNGEITIEDGGTIINYGVINIEGPEAKPQDPAGEQQEAGETMITDQKTADMVIDAGGRLENHGCISLKGILYVNGTLDNYGQFNDTIDAGDPDKGVTGYHRGIQLTWKDVVTEEGIEPGKLYLGMIPGSGSGPDGRYNPEAELNNYGDIVAVPGEIHVYAKLNNIKGTDYSGHIYLCDDDEAVLPIKPGKDDDPMTKEKRVELIPPKESILEVYEDRGGIFDDQGVTGPARVTLLKNGVLGILIPLTSINRTTTKVKLDATSFTYNGKIRKPAVASITVDGQYLAQNVNYKVEYSDASSKDVGSYTITIRGCGEYGGKWTGTYTIGKASLKGAKLVLSDTSFTYNGKVQKPVIRTAGGNVLKEGKDYTAVYSDKSSKAAGSYTVKIKGKGNCTGTSASAAYKICKAANTLKVTPKTKQLKASTLKKKDVTVKRSQILTVGSARGNVTYSKVSGDSRIRIDAKTGNATVKKGTPKGTYKTTVRVKAAGNSNYKAVFLLKTFTIKVK